MSTGQTLYDIILGLEDHTWRAMQQSGSALLPFLSRDCIMQFPLGLRVSGKTQPSLVDVMNSQAFIPWKSYEMSDIEVMPVGADSAIICYTVIATREPMDGAGGGEEEGEDEEDEDEDTFRGLLSSVWRLDRDAGRWLMCFHQQTPHQIV